MPSTEYWQNLLINDDWIEERQAAFNESDELGLRLLRARRFPVNISRVQQCISHGGIGWDTENSRFVLPLRSINDRIFSAKLWRQYYGEQKKFRWITAGWNHAREMSKHGEPIGRVWDLPWIVNRIDAGKIQPGTWLWFVAGEWDCIMARIGNFPATCLTTGETTSIRSEVLISEFGGKDTAVNVLSAFEGIGIVYDCDTAGHRGSLKLFKAIDEMCQEIEIAGANQNWHGIRVVDLSKCPWFPTDSNALDSGWDYSDYVVGAIATKEKGIGSRWLRSAVLSGDFSAEGVSEIAVLFGVDETEINILSPAFLPTNIVRTITLPELLEGAISYAKNQGSRKEGAFHLGIRAARNGWNLQQLLEAGAVQQYKDLCDGQFPRGHEITIGMIEAGLSRSFNDVRRPEHQDTDQTNMHRLQEHFPYIMYHPSKRWLLWNKKAWVDGNVSIYDFARQIPNKIDEESSIAMANGEGILGARLKRWAKETRKMKTQKSMIEMASHSNLFRPAAEIGEQWDGAPNFIGTSNGVIDLDNGRLLTEIEARNCYCSAATNGTLIDLSSADDDIARCVKYWEKLLTDWHDDPAVISMLQEIAGTCLVGQLTEQVWIFQSSGRSGKSTFLDALSYSLGDYAYEIIGSVISKNRFGGNDNAKTSAIARLDGKRMVVISEVGGKTLDTDIIKQLTGERTMMGRAMRSDPVAIKNHGTYFLMTNHEPDLRGDQSDALHGRIVVVPWPKSFIHQSRASSEDNVLGLRIGNVAIEDIGIKNIVMGQVPEFSAMPDVVLSWAFAGLMRYRSRGYIAIAPRVLERTEAVWAESDILATFFIESGLWVKGGETIVATGGLWNLMRDWSVGNDPTFYGLLGNSSQVLAEILKQHAGRGYENIGKSTKALFMGDKRQVNAWKIPWTFIGHSTS